MAAAPPSKRSLEDIIPDWISALRFRSSLRAKERASMEDDSTIDTHVVSRSAEAEAPKTNQQSPKIPTTIPLSAEAKLVCDLAAWIGADSSSDSEHSFSTLLLALLTAEYPISAWLRRYAEANGVKIEIVASRAGMTLQEAQEHLPRASDGPPSSDKIAWTESAIDLLKSATELAQKTANGSPILDVRHLVAGYIYGPHDHDRDIADIGFDPKKWSDAFISRIARDNRLERTRWEEIHEQRFGEPATPVLAESTVPLANDLWTTADTLGHSAYADAIYYFLVHRDTSPPLSISIQAPWGAGKTSLMRMVQSRLDPEALEAARSGGWRSLQRKRWRHDLRLRLAQVIRFLDEPNPAPYPVMQVQEKRATAIKRTAEQSDSRHRWTVWFNAWKYETSEQLWSGLVDAVVTQVTDRLRPDQRELFLLRLNLARLDNNVIRERIYNRIALAWWSKIRPWLVALGCVTLGVLGIRVAEPELSLLNWTIAGLPTIGGAYVVIQFFVSKKKATEEPAKFSLSEFIKVPDYTKATGTVHQVYDDLRKVFSAIPHDRLPLTVFIDDLDRCAPDKVAKVVEGVNLFMAGDLRECMFVIGMDPQLVATALQAAHADLINQLPSYDRRTPIGWRFMDKFVQMAFSIPPSDRDEVAEYKRSLTSQREVARETAEATEPSGASETNASLAGSANERSSAPSASILDLAEREIIAAKVLGGDDPAVQRMMREVGDDFSRNPRDLKRLLNLLRFQILIKRMRAADGRGTPADAQLERWITLSLRNPDCVRWLQWTRGCTTEETNLLSGRLIKLEAIAERVSDPELWKQAVVATFNLHEAGVSWLDDPDLLSFFQLEAKLPAGERLSDGALRGYW